MAHSQEQDIAIDNRWLDDNNSEPYSRKGKGKERNADSYVDLQSPDASTERFDASVYPPANDELEETRRVEEVSTLSYISTPTCSKLDLES